MRRTGPKSDRKPATTSASPPLVGANPETIHRNGTTSVHWEDAVSHFGMTDVGVKRSHNQDAYGVALAPTSEAWESRGHLFLVADGMGSHAVGELASKLAVDTIQHTYTKMRGVSPELALRQAIVEANQTIFERGQQNREFKGMGTTATALVLMPEGATVGHVGDSRCYHIRGKRIEQLSFDHSLQWELARRQKVNPDELSSVPSNIIIRSLGPDSIVKIDVTGLYPYDVGDRFLLCSDGLSGPISDRELWAVASFLPGEEACQFLVDLANLRGGLDNITVLLVQVGDPATPRRRSRGQIIQAITKWSKRLLAKISLPWRVFLGGVAFALLAGIVKAFEGPFVVPIASAGAILMGIAGWLFNRSEHRRQIEADYPAPEPPPVFRPQDCELEPVLIENLSRMEKTLREMALEEQWRVDRELLEERRREAESHATARRLPEAFREYCRAICVLSAGLREFRAKHEVFMPHFQPESS